MFGRVDANAGAAEGIVEFAMERVAGHRGTGQRCDLASEEFIRGEPV
jgi:hypothetical protein